MSEYLNDFGVTPETLEAMKNGEEPVIVEEAAPEVPVEETLLEEVGEPAPEEVVEETPEAPRKGDVNVPIKALRNENAQLKAVLQDPNMLAQHLAQMGYQVAPANQAQQPQQTAATDPMDQLLELVDPEIGNALKAVLESKLAPLENEVGSLREREAEALRRAEQEATIRQYDQEIPGFASAVSEFDQTNPQVAGHYGPVDKYLMVTGAKAADPSQRGAFVAQLLQQMAPEEREAILNPLVKASASQQVQAIISQNGPNKGGRPVTLGGATPAKGNETLPAINSLSTEDWMALPKEVRDRLKG